MSVRCQLGRSALAVAVLALVCPRVVHAQLAPAGAHYGAKPSDTGHDLVGPNENGDFIESVPLDLPPAHGGLPIPLEIVSGGHGFGAAGVGWDIPLSYVLVDDSFAHRRPAMEPGQQPDPREHIVVALPGRRVDMISVGTDVWVARNAPDITMTSVSGLWFKVVDGNGLAYTFSRTSAFSDVGIGMWLLESITGPGNAGVQMTYDIHSDVVPGAPGNTISVDLREIDYNRHPSGDCFKTRILLGYEPVAPGAAAQSLSVIGPAVFARTHKLDSVDVTSVAACGDSPVRVQHYELDYDPDPDTGLQRLAGVKLSGRDGTNEASKYIPLAAYTYGTATSVDATGAQRLQLAWDPEILFPSAAVRSSVASIAETRALDASVFQSPVGGTAYGTIQSFTDFTGDGRPDLVFPDASGHLQIAFNDSTAGGAAAFTNIQPFTDSTFTKQVLDVRTSSASRFSQTPVDQATEEYVWRQAIDVNGDGRVDVIDASEAPDKWIVYLNKPGGLHGIEWVRRVYDVSRLRHDLQLLNGYSLPGNYVPLSRRVTARSYKIKQCFKWDDSSSTWLEAPELIDIKPECLSGDLADPPPPEAQQTVVDWEIADINGDGYIDFVFNAAPSELKGDRPSGYSSGESIYRLQYQTFDLKRNSNDIYVALNIAGLGIHRDGYATDPFSHSTLLLENKACGVEKWKGVRWSDGTELQELTCTFIDVNGDGLLDRVDDMTASLGTGTTGLTDDNKPKWFNSVQITLPSYVDVQHSGYTDAAACNVGFQTYQWTGLRDVTGDGIPDLLFSDLSGDNAPLQLAVGTGAGFTASSTDSFDLSREDEGCVGGWSQTKQGLFDLTGDGKPDYVEVNLNTYGQWVISVKEIVSSSGTPGTPEAGRIVTVDNGAGAVTTIAYRSAKEDLSNEHKVPFPEIVVDHTETTATHGLGGSQSRTSFAYRYISMYYDSYVDAFRPTGYLRRISLVTTASSGILDRPTGSATIVDGYPLDGWSLDSDAEFLRYQKVGRTADTTVLAVGPGTDPWRLLDVNIFSDVRRYEGSHNEISDHVFTEGGWPALSDDCIDILEPFDFDWSKGMNLSLAYKPCTGHGYSYVSTSTAYRGSGPATSTGVQTQTSVTKVDDLGRPLSIVESGDIHRADDDVCIDITYADAALPDYPVASLPATRRVGDCDKSTTTYAEDSYEYDGLPTGLASDGLMTSHTIHRHATDTGYDYGPIRQYDISYDASGNPITAVTTREDGAQRTVTTTYDDFGLVPMTVTVQGSNLPALKVTNTYDPVTEQLLTSTDATGTTRGSTFDGFGRPVYQTIQTPGSSIGVQTAWTYFGFENPSAGRQVQVKTFADAVPEADVKNAEGRVATTYLDELARPRFTYVDLGDDYNKQTLVVGARIYDGLGRISFEADPYPTTQDTVPPTTAYGTTQFYRYDGSLDVSIRGRGPQGYSKVPDPALERYPTVYNHTFDNYEETTTTQTPDALVATSPQYGVVKQTVLDATGRVMSRSTVQSGTRLEYEQLAYDHLGQQTALTRYQDAATPANPVTWTWQFDSLGQVTALTEPSSAPQSRSYSNWGELKNIEWTPTSEPVHDINYGYDALGRIEYSQESNGGIDDPDTTYKFGYDDPRVSPIVDNKYTLGRLSFAAGPGSEVRFGYDEFGNVAARTFIDNKDDSTYVEQHSYHTDGSQKSIELDLPDTSYTPERMSYEYDTAGRLRWMWFDDGSNTQELLNVTGMDVWGRLNKATFGLKNSLSAAYGETDRRLPKNVTVQAGIDKRTFSFDAFDAVGRELSRTHATKLFAGTETRTYDALGRLQTTVRKAGSTTVSQSAFAYDPLGNITTLGDQLGSADATLSYLTTDRDRICRIGYGNGGLGGTTCNVTYDSFGNVVKEPTRTGANSLTFANSGLVRKISNSSGDATFQYDPFGGLETLDIKTSSLTRHDHNYGALILKRKQSSSSASADYISRLFPGAGFVISRRGKGGPWVYEYSDANGTRFTADDSGVFAQDVDYAPYGETTSKGAIPGDKEYTANQWNEGDALEGLGLVVLGARVYDPVIGRFLSRDPIVVPRTASTTNPYAFAFNDPVNFGDPSGMDPDPCGTDPLCISNVSPDESTLQNVAALGAWMADWFIDWGGDPSTVPFGSQKELATFYAAYDAQLSIRHLNRQVYGAIGALNYATGKSASKSTFGSIVDGVEDFGAGFASGVYDMGAGVVHMAIHPVETVEAFGHMAAHPIQTAEAIGHSVYATGAAIYHGDMRAAGHAAGSIFGPAAALKVVGTIAEAAEAAEVAEVAEAGTVASEAPKAYSVAYQTELAPTSYPGLSRAAHFREANTNLLGAMEADPEFASQMENLGIKIERTPTGLVPAVSPEGWTWHHAIERGVMQLVRRAQHMPGSAYQELFHPGGIGGFSLWGK